MQRCNAAKSGEAIGAKGAVALVRSAPAQRRGASRAPAHAARRVGGRIRVRGSDQVPANLSTLKCGLRWSWRPGSDNVRYLRQFGEHILGSSFTALDPNRPLPDRSAKRSWSRRGRAPPPLKGTDYAYRGWHVLPLVVPWGPPLDAPCTPQARPLFHRALMQIVDLRFHNLTQGEHDKSGEDKAECDACHHPKYNNRIIVRTIIPIRYLVEYPTAKDSAECQKY